MTALCSPQVNSPKDDTPQSNGKEHARTHIHTRTRRRTRIHTRRCTHTYTHTHTFIHIQTWPIPRGLSGRSLCSTPKLLASAVMADLITELLGACVQVCVHASACACGYGYGYVCVRVHVHVLVCVCVCVYVCAYLCVNKTACASLKLHCNLRRSQGCVCSTVTP
jgi:hypothetical protein